MEKKIQSFKQDLMLGDWDGTNVLETRTKPL
jgi:hypothetical protein